MPGLNYRNEQGAHCGLGKHGLCRHKPIAFLPWRLKTPSARASTPGDSFQFQQQTPAAMSPCGCFQTPGPFTLYYIHSGKSKLCRTVNRAILVCAIVRRWWSPASSHPPTSAGTVTPGGSKEQLNLGKQGKLSLQGNLVSVLNIRSWQSTLSRSLRSEAVSIKKRR